MHRNHIVSHDDIGSDHADAEMTIHDIDSQAAPGRSDTFPHRQNQWHRHKKVSHLFIFYRSVCVELMAVFLKVQLSLVCVSKWHGNGEVKPTILPTLPTMATEPGVFGIEARIVTKLDATDR